MQYTESRHLLEIWDVEQSSMSLNVVLFSFHIRNIPPHRYINTYRFTHTGWDCKDDQKLGKYADPKVKSSLLLRIKSFLYLILRFSKKRNKFTVAGNHNYEVTESKNSVQSSLKSHPSWVTLYKITSLLPPFTRPWS